MEVVKRLLHRFWKWEHFWLCVLLVLTLALHFSIIFTPNKYVLDEEHYIQDARAILQGEETLRPEHAPLGKVLIVSGLAVFGDNMVGIVHPSKIYGAMAVGRPVLLIGPASCHIAEIIREYQVGWTVRQGDVAGVAEILQAINRTSLEELARMGERSRTAIRDHFSKDIQVARFCDVLERETRCATQARKHVHIA